MTLLDPLLSSCNQVMVTLGEQGEGGEEMGSSNMVENRKDHLLGLSRISFKLGVKIMRNCNGKINKIEKLKTLASLYIWILCHGPRFWHKYRPKFSLLKLAEKCVNYVFLQLMGVIKGE